MVAGVKLPDGADNSQPNVGDQGVSFSRWVKGVCTNRFTIRNLVNFEISIANHDCGRYFESGDNDCFDGVFESAYKKMILEQALLLLNFLMTDMLSFRLKLPSLKSTPFPL